MSTHSFNLTPRDLLFLRDARPMEASDAGLGAHWPRPDQLWNALINAFHRQWPERQTWEGHEHRKNNTDRNQDSSCRFGALLTAGPFPCVRTSTPDTKAGLYLPCPLDLSADTDGNLHPMTLVSAAGSNLPPPLTHAFAAAAVLGKNELPLWLHAADYAACLQGRTITPAKASLYAGERNIGIAIDPVTHATVEGQFYQAEYLRLGEHVSLAFAASCDIRGDRGQPTDVLAEFAKTQADTVVIGGQQGLAKLRRDPQPLALPQPALAPPRTAPFRLRWTLLTPAVYPAIAANPDKGVNAPHPGGWLPNWVHPESGEVMLPRTSVARGAGEGRDAWRQRVKTAPRFSARLMAARIGKPLPFSGWDLQTGGPKPTHLAVPAGSVYVFACQSADEWLALAKALAWNAGDGCEVRNRRSTLLGEKGFGLGVCSAWGAPG